jgi:hypothetical protein
MREKTLVGAEAVQQLHHRGSSRMSEGDVQPIDVAIDLPFDLLQTLRLAQAISEAGFRICVPPADEVKVVALKKIFGFDYKVGTADAARIADLCVDHMTPLTRVGAIACPLIMPQAVFSHCRARWPERRDLDVSFGGILTESRRTALNAWLRLSGLEQLSVPEQPSLFRRALRKAARKVGISIGDYVGTDNVKIYLSDQGRRFPRKSWNTAYYDLLLRSKYVLCPSGDFKNSGVAWTYRFFEGAICGAIPIIEENCPAYEGYRVRYMSDPIGTLDWSPADAEHNFALARERLTLDSKALRAEVLGLLRAPGTAPDGPRRDSVQGIYAT